MPIRMILLDRDGTLNIEVDNPNPGNIQAMPDAFDVLGAWIAGGIRLGVVTNQSGVARGVTSFDEIDTVQRLLLNQIGIPGRLLPFYICPHHPTAGDLPLRGACTCRKPQPGLLIQAMKDAGIGPAETVMIGNAQTDMQAGRAAGLAACILLGDAPCETGFMDTRVDSLTAAADWLKASRL